MIRHAFLAAFVLCIGLAACNRTDSQVPATPPEKASGAATNSTDPSSGSGMEGMSPPAATAPVMAHGIGRVTALNMTAGTVTIDHQPIPQANWPAMTMTFHAAAPVLRGVRVGDEISFDVTIQGGEGEVTSMRSRS